MVENSNTNVPLIIGMAGRAGAGKDIVSDHLIECGLVSRKVPLAAYLKKLSHDICNIPMADLYAGKKNDLTDVKVTTDLVRLIPSLGSRVDTFLTVREVLQYLGTDLLRRFFPDCWVNALLNSIEDDESIVVSDVRFPNECIAIKERGGILVRLTRNPSKMDHESEILLDNYDGFDIIHDNTDETVDETLTNIFIKINDYIEHNKRR